MQTILRSLSAFLILFERTCSGMFQIKQNVTEFNKVVCGSYAVNKLKNTLSWLQSTSRTYVSVLWWILPLAVCRGGPLCLG